MRVKGGALSVAVLFLFYAVSGNAKTQLGWVRGLGRHGGEAPALCVGTDDVGLDSLVLSYQEESTNKTKVPMPGCRSHRCLPLQMPTLAWHGCCYGQNRPVRLQYASYSSPKSLRRRFSSLRTWRSMMIMNAINTSNARQLHSQTQTPA